MTTILAGLFFAGVFAIAIWAIVDIVAAQHGRIAEVMRRESGAAINPLAASAARRPVRVRTELRAPRRQPALRAAA